MPAVRPLNHPAVSFMPSLPRRGHHSAMGDVGYVTSPLCRESDVVKVIALIGTQVLLNCPWRRPGDDQRIQCRSKMDLVMDVGSRERYSQRNSLPIDDEVAFFVPSLPRSVGFLPVLSPLLLGRTPSRCPETATPSRCLCRSHIPASRGSRFWQRLPPWSISGNAHGPWNRNRTRVEAFSTGIRSEGHTGCR